MATSAAIINILYPASAASNFDMDYYLSHHMPLVMKYWKPYGMRGWTVVELDKYSGYYVQAIVDFESLEGFDKAMSAECNGEVMDDIKKFTNESPVRWIGMVHGISSRNTA
ncbi:putative ethyl tert-butyl ether degradation protein [Seiridium unicorne]|uniref:Ethyl tert-butyl ether degradation protein n=1 Tax=Seiridium unicorne TaxID=138068 RepID=A0ABR2VFJ4_9PEZI